MFQPDTLEVIRDTVYVVQQAQQEGIDPAWFYSALAQSSAAIVGLIGAILGNRMLSHIDSLEDLRSVMNHIILNAFKSLSGVKERHASYLDTMHTTIDTIKNSSNQDVVNGFVVKEDTWGNLTDVFITVNNKDERLNKYVSDYEKIIQAQSKLPDFKQLLTNTRVSNIIDTLQELKKNNAINESHYNDFDPSLYHLNRLSTLFDKYIQRLLPGIYKYLFLSLGIITVVGLLWPIYKLTHTDIFAGTFQMILLFTILLTIGLFGFFGFLFYKVNRMDKIKWKVSKEEIRDVNIYESYSN